MKKFLTKLAVAALVTVPMAAFAASLVPCGTTPLSANPTQQEIINATSCSLCNLEQLVQNIINYLIGLSIPIAVGLFAWAGILLFTSAESPANITKAKKIFSSALIGFVIVISAWLIVQTVLTALTGGSGSWNTLQCSTADRPRESQVTDMVNAVTVVQGDSGVVANENAIGNVDTSFVAQRFDQINRDDFASHGVTVNKPDCTSSGQTDCTSVGGLQKVTIAGADALGDILRQQDPTCANVGCVVITGGNEAGHAAGVESHASGCKLDFRQTPQLTSYITTNGGTPTTRTSDGAQQYTINGVIYAGESDHWDVQYCAGQ